MDITQIGRKDTQCFWLHVFEAAKSENMLRYGTLPQAQFFEFITLKYQGIPCLPLLQDTNKSAMTDLPQFPVLINRIHYVMCDT